MLKAQDDSYSPPFEMNDHINNLAMNIAQLVGFYSGATKRSKMLHLRKASKINTVYSSLAIENNRLSREQVSAILDGKRVIGPRKDILEVENAFRTYDQFANLNPFNEKDFLKAHSILTDNLISSSGRYRSGQVGVFDGDVLIHAGIPAKLVPLTMGQLFSWLKRSEISLLIKSCIFHYEMVFINPFEDGNGRMARLWQSLILKQWDQLFEWLPVETLVFENQDKYYEAINNSNHVGNSVPFVEFMLSIIQTALKEAVETVDGVNGAENGAEIDVKNPEDESNRTDLVQSILHLMSDNPGITIKELTESLKVSRRTVDRLIVKLKNEGILSREGSARNGKWIIHQS